MTVAIEALCVSMACQTWTPAVPMATPMMISLAFAVSQTPERRYCGHDRPLLWFGIG